MCVSYTNVEYWANLNFQVYAHVMLKLRSRGGYRKNSS